MTRLRPTSTPSLLLIVGAALALAACGRAPDQPAATNASAPAASLQADQAATPAAATTAEADRAALEAREKELADREAALKQKEVELELAKRETENAKTAVKTAKAQTLTPKTESSAPTGTRVASAAKPTPAPLVVPSGTPLSIELTQNVNTKKVAVGDPVNGKLQRDVMVGDKVAIAAGAQASGSVTQVISGSNKIGGVPTLGISFTTLTLPNGGSLPISGDMTQQGVSETGKDTAKILGGAAAGAVIGHQVNDKNGTVVGGVLGGAAGAAAAQKTGGDVKIVAGTVVEAKTTSSYTVQNW